MSDYRDKPDTIPFRLLDVKDDFYKYAEQQGLNSSKTLRHIIRQATKEGATLTPTEQKKILDELALLRNQLARVGGNLNQIARYFNQHDYLIESDLKKNLDESKRLFTETTETLKGVADVIR